MSWFSKIIRKGPQEEKPDVQALQKKFSLFLAILDSNNRVLKIISDMEEKSQGEYLFDINYIRSSLSEVRAGVLAIVQEMIALGGGKYAELKNRYDAIDRTLSQVFPENRPVEKDAFTFPLEEVGRDQSWSVGSKSAQLGELKSRLGLPAPEGFAISAWAYKHFIDANDLQSRISDCIGSVDIKHYDDLVRVSDRIRGMVTSGRVPDDLAGAIRESFARLRARVEGPGFALRSSAIGEDTLFSFAGQYATYLNVRESEIVDRYRAVLASKFTPQAIYYYLSHSFSEADLAMGVGCLAMIDSRSSGVVYTRDPVLPQDECHVIYAIYGLGKYLVDGTLMPDVFRVSREDGRTLEASVASKPVRLVLGPDGGTREEAVPASERDLPSLNEEQIRKLAGFARQIEAHYGSPMDIEWAMGPDGEPVLLQARPLRVIEPREAQEEPDVSGLERLLAGGTTVCPGAGCGPVFHLHSTEDLSRVPAGSVLVAPLPFPGLVTVMNKVAALVTQVGSTASHMATLAREYQIPTLVGLEHADRLEAGKPVTVDATGRAVYAGRAAQVFDCRRAASGDVDDTGIYTLLKEVLGNIAPLRLLHPDDPDFRAENCRTFHDITRFVHQMAMEEMFSLGKNVQNKERVGLRLKSDIPLQVHIIYIDQEVDTGKKARRWVEEDRIDSVPMTAFWNGIRQHGWPTQAPGGELKGFMSVMATKLSTSTRGEFSESSFAVLSKEYMILSLRMGYHFTTVESMCTQVAANNYIRFQCKGGGASIERRTRRIRLFREILSRVGFQFHGTGDFIDAKSAYQNPGTVQHQLTLLGRITMMTKQLDMALSNDSITAWYIQDYLKQLGLDAGGAS